MPDKTIIFEKQKEPPASPPLASASRPGVLLTCDADDVGVLSTMLENAKKKQFVSQNHHKVITQISTGRKAGKWKTYVGDPRKEVVRSTEKELIDYLYLYYTQLLRPEPTYKEVFDELMDYKVNQLNRSLRTESAYRVIFNRFTPDRIASCKISKISEEMILEWISSTVKDLHPKPDALRKLIQQANNVFEFAMRKKYRIDNPAVYIDIHCYLKDCENERKTDEEKEFSESELEKLWESCLKDSDNPRALMAMMASCTGMRGGELPVLHWSDVEDRYLHIHRQQVRETAEGKIKHSELRYTKDERTHPHDGRRFPITKNIRTVLDLAKSLPGSSEKYVFHDKAGKPPTKDSYNHNLRKRCLRLGFQTTNNHAFRMALNSRLIAKGVDSSQRALLLGHSVETNERHYSLTDKRRLDALDAILLE